MENKIDRLFYPWDNVSRFFKRRLHIMSKSRRYRKMTRHHRKPKARGGKSGKHRGNISMVPYNKHRAFHTLFGTITPEKIARMLTRDYIDPDRIMIAVPKELWEKLMRQVAERGGCSKIKRTLQFIDRSTKS